MKTLAFIPGVLVMALMLLAGCKSEPRGLTMRMGPAQGTPHKEYHVSVRARPVFKDKSDYSLLVLPAVKGRTVEVICDPTFSPWLKDLPRDRDLTFTLWQTKRVAWHTDDGEESFWWESEVETIKDGSKLIYDAAVCPIHKVRMARCEVRISHGTPSEEYFDAYKEFSGGPGFVWAGCVSLKGEPTTEFGYKCDQCVAAYQRWSADRKAERLKAAKAALPPSPAVTESEIEVPLPEHTPYDASPKLKEIYLRGYASGWRVGITGYRASCDTAGSKEHPEYGEALTSGNFAGQEAGSLVYAAKHPSTD